MKYPTENLVHLTAKDNKVETECGLDAMLFVIRDEPTEVTCKACLDERVRYCVFDKDLAGARAAYARMDQLVMQSLENKGIIQS